MAQKIIRIHKSSGLTLDSGCSLKDICMASIVRSSVSAKLTSSRPKYRAKNIIGSPLMTSCTRGSGPLTTTQVANLQREHGLNEVAIRKKRKWYGILLGAFVHPFNVLLILLATTTAVSGDLPTMGIMSFMVATSTVLRFYQEWKSELAVDSLLTFIETEVKVRRQHKQQTAEFNVPSKELVVGDWVRLFPGNLIPADVEIVECKDFHVSQAALTGEPMPVHKRPYMMEGIAEDEPTETTGSSENLLIALEQSNNRPSWLSTQIRKLFGLPVYTYYESLESGRDQSDLDKPYLCFMGSAVVSGTATCRVRATGSRTLFGQLAKDLASRRPQSAFQLGVRRISWIFFGTMVVMIPPVVLLQGFLVGNGWNNAFLFALAVAVGLTPEMLPMIVSTTLAKGAVDMSKKRCIVKHLDAIINMGGIDVLCTDKTGTLTKSEVTLNGYLNAKMSSNPVALCLGYLNSKLQQFQENPIDESVRRFVEGGGGEGVSSSSVAAAGVLDKVTLKGELPFDFERRRVSVIVQGSGEGEGKKTLVCKGAFDEVLDKCGKVWTGSKLDDDQVTDIDHILTVVSSGGEIITEKKRTEIIRMNKTLTEDGLRVIGVAFKTLTTGGEEYSVEDENDMTFVGFLTFLDPPKESTAGAIFRLMEHSVTVKVLTGDDPSVCRKICNEIGLAADSDAVITGRELAIITATSHDAILHCAERYTIFAKLTPTQKAEVVRALKRKGHIVGFLGDGINDAPAITEADVGISVDTGTDICKEAADVILLEKDLSVVVSGIITGRRTYGNTLKYLVMAISSNFGNVFSVLTASAWLPFEPMAPIHILVQNLLYDVSQVAIPWDNLDPEFLLVPHRWSMTSVLRFMIWMGPWSSVFDIATFLFMYYYFGIKTSDDNVALFQTTWFTIGLLTQTLIVHMIRTPKIPFLQSFASFPMSFMTAVIMWCGLAIPYIPWLSSALGMVPLYPIAWQVYPFLVAVLIAYCLLAQIAKVIYKKLFQEWY